MKEGKKTERKNGAHERRKKRRKGHLKGERKEATYKGRKDT
jgi:hypothetical protein